jgi:DNA-binding transcriptional MerR regulator
MTTTRREEGIADSERAGDFGIPGVSAVTLSHWRRDGLLERPRRVSQGGTKGFRSEWPEDDAKRVKRILELRRETRDLQRIRARVWADGYAVPIEHVKEDLIAFLQSADDGKAELGKERSLAVGQTIKTAIVAAKGYRTARIERNGETDVAEGLKGVEEDIQAAKAEALNNVRDHFRHNREIEEALGRLWALFGKERYPSNIILEEDDELRAALLVFLFEGRLLQGRDATFLQCYGVTTDLLSRALKGEKLQPAAWAGEDYTNWRGS